MKQEAAYLIEVKDIWGDIIARRIAMTPGDAANWIDSFAEKHGCVFDMICEGRYSVYGKDGEFDARYTAIGMV